MVKKAFVVKLRLDWIDKYMWKQIRFGKDNGIFGIEDLPDMKSPQSLVITLPGLGQAMSEKNYLFSTLRKRLSKLKQWIIQFDFRGCGDSFGDMRETTISSMTYDVLEVLDEIKQERSLPHIFLVGNALGTVVALRVAIMLIQAGVRCSLILISLPVDRLPHSSDTFDIKGLSHLYRYGYADVKLLVPGSDYVTNSDFDQKQHQYLSALGAHIINMHGQYISSNMIEEIDQFDLDFMIKSGNYEQLVVICGEKFTSLEKIKEKVPMAKVYFLKGVTYYYQSPAAMDELIKIIENTVSTNS